MAFVAGRLINFIINVPPINRDGRQSPVKNLKEILLSTPEVKLSRPPIHRNDFKDHDAPPFSSSFLKMLTFDGLTSFGLAALDGTGLVDVSSLT